MRIAHFGTFDVENYGDLLFPLVLERRLSDLDAEFVHVSPVGGPPPWADCRSTISIAEALESRFDAVIVGGGHIVHARASNLARYRVDPTIAALAYSSLWLGASELAARLEVPLVWNAPGVPAAFDSSISRLAAWAAAACDHLAVRDPRSLERIRATGFAGPIEVVLDTAVDVADLFAESERQSAWETAFASREQSIPERSIVIHVNDRYVDDNVDAVAACIDRIAGGLEARPVLAALGPCHGDSELASRIASRMDGPCLLIERPRSLCEIAALIEGSIAYVGTSLHGLITAAAFGRPGIVVAQESPGGAAKFTGFLDQWQSANGPSSLSIAGNWPEAEKRLGESGLERPAEAGTAEQKPGWLERIRRLGRDEPAPEGRPIPRDGATTQGGVDARLDHHWPAVASALSLPPDRCKSRRGGSRLALESVVRPDWSRRAIFGEVLRGQGES